MSNNNNFWKNAMNYGAILGLALIIYSVVLYLLNFSNARGAGIFSYLILIAGIIMAIKNYRDKTLGGYMNYGTGLGLGTVIGLFAGILLGFYIFLQMKFIDPDIIEQGFRIQEERMLERGMNEDQVEMSIEMARKFATPVATAVSTIFFMTLFGFVVSLIAAAILKKDDDGYNSAMQNIQ